jgi:hypothetical protein
MKNGDGSESEVWVMLFSQFFDTNLHKTRVRKQPKAKEGSESKAHAVMTTW